jgi:hypothetical protein
LKTITIRKSHDFSPNSKVILHVGSNQKHIKGFEPISFSIEPGQKFYASQQWARSNLISYDNATENKTYFIKPRLDKMLALLTVIIFLTCTVFFFVTKFRWSYVPLSPIVLYVFVYLTILKNRYLIIGIDKTINN